jgi:hypothetical protein
MDDWKLVIEYPEGSDGKPHVYWRARFPEENVSTRVLPESPMWQLERELLALDHETEDYVLHPPPTREERRRVVSEGFDEYEGRRERGPRSRSMSRGRREEDDRRRSYAG